VAIEKSVWRQGTLNEDAIRARHVPPSQYRISRKSYGPGVTFTGASRAGICYVLEGECKYSFSESVTLGEGEYAELPEGQFTFSVLGAKSVTLVQVWLLPEKFWRVE
jgi:hypothetical protein